MVVSKESIQKILLLLRPYMQDERERRAYLMRALGVDAPVLNRLVWNTSVDVFVVGMVKELVAFGEVAPGQSALYALLEVIREDAGVGSKERINELLWQLREEKKPQPSQGIWRCLHTLSGHSEMVRSVAINLDGQTIASGSADKTVKLWNLKTGELLRTIKENSSAVLSVAFSPDGQTLAAALWEGKIKLWDVCRGTLHQTFEDALLNLPVGYVTFSPDGHTLASGHTLDAKINLWDLGSGKVRYTLRAHGWEVKSAAFSSDGQILVSGGLDGAIQIWNWRTGILLRTLNRPSPSDFVASFVSFFDYSVGGIWSVAVSPNGQILASGGSEQPIMLWNAGTGRLVRTFTEHSARVNSVTFSPDGQTFASGGDDETIKVWNFHTGELLQTLGHLGPVKSIAFSADGRFLVSGCDDTTIKVWCAYP